MGVPMVQKQSRRKSSLIMGALLALLLGVAAGFFVLAMPTHLLETVTTMTRLSKLMTQAEPPIMPYDKTVLAVLAGTLTAGIGWVAIDWLLFGRAGMRTLIREREDDYEESDGDTFRPTDPLDLVAPVSLPTGDWASSATSDPRRPLSARTDIGDPPMSTAPQGLQPIAMPGIDELLPPIDRIQPVSGATPPAFPPIAPFQAAPPPNPFQQPGTEPQTGNMFGSPAMPFPAKPTETLGSPAEAAGLQPPQPQSASPTRAWLPTPGVRPDGSTSPFEQPSSVSDSDDDDALDLTTPQLPQAEPMFVPEPLGYTPPPLQLVTPQPAAVFAPPAAPIDIAPISDVRPPASIAPAVPPAEPPRPMAPPPLAIEPPDFPVPPPPRFEHPAPPFAVPSGFQPAMPTVSQPPAFEPVAPSSVPPPTFVPSVPPVAPPVAAPVVPSQPSVPRRTSPDGTIAGLDKGRLEELLARLERGLEARRAAAARAAASPPAPVQAPQSAVTPDGRPLPGPPPAALHQPPLATLRSEAPVTHHASANPEPLRPVVAPTVFAAPTASNSQPVAPTTAPVYDLPTMPISPAYNLTPIQPPPQAFLPETGIEDKEPTSDALLDQPLHMTLDLLRNKVRR